MLARASSLLATTAMFTGIAFGAAAQNASEAQIKELALQAILENPEIIMQALEILQQREEASAEIAADAALDAGRMQLERDPNAPVLGNAAGDVTIVEFFDYNCGYCRRAGAVLQEVLSADTGVRAVMREWPILGEGSVFAARAALAAREQGKYEQMHWGMMQSRGRVDEASVLRIAKDVGLDITQLKADMNSAAVNAHLSATNELAQSLGFQGTPAFVVGEMRAPGMIPAQALFEAIAELRAKQ